MTILANFKATSLPKICNVLHLKMIFNSKQLCTMRDNSTKTEVPFDMSKIDRDYIGSPDALSNLPARIFHKPVNETKLAAKFREKNLEVHEFNQKFWSNHNKRFYEDKEEFIRLHKKNSQDTITPDELSRFFKYFLDKNYKLHFLYNVSWYSKNLELMLLAAGVNLEKFLRRFTKK